MGPWVNTFILQMGRLKSRAMKTRVKGIKLLTGKARTRTQASSFSDQCSLCETGKDKAQDIKYYFKHQRTGKYVFRNIPGTEL